MKSFQEQLQKEEAFEYVKRGTRVVPVDQIVGSVGRYRDFDGTFSLKSHLPRERLDKIRQAMLAGKSLPPVDLYQIKDEFYVLDGNHRIAAAKGLGRSEIAARIVEFIPSKDTLENVLYRERSDFYSKTGLPFSIELTEVGQSAICSGRLPIIKTTWRKRTVGPCPLRRRPKTGTKPSIGPWPR